MENIFQVENKKVENEKDYNVNDQWEEGGNGSKKKSESKEVVK